MKHTPAPWAARDNHVGRQYIDHNGYTVASFDSFNKVAQPDLALIIAAPELLAALIAVTLDVGELGGVQGETWAQVQAAIAKAGGAA
jgi:hypothetical protein